MQDENYDLFIVKNNYSDEMWINLSLDETVKRVFVYDGMSYKIKKGLNEHGELTWVVHFKDELSKNFHKTSIEIAEKSKDEAEREFLSGCFYKIHDNIFYDEDKWSIESVDEVMVRMKKFADENCIDLNFSESHYQLEKSQICINSILIDSQGNRLHFSSSRLHREDGPAVEMKQKGKPHWLYGETRYWLHGEGYATEEWRKMAEARKTADKSMLSFASASL